MIDILSVDNMRKSDAHTIAQGVSGRELMRRAAEGVFGAVRWTPPVAVVCGSGNNGGDGYCLAQILHSQGIECTVFMLGDRFSADGRYYYEQCLADGVNIARCDRLTTFKGYATVIDCIFGTGFRGAVTGLEREIIAAVNESDAYTVSVDINSGLNGDSGMAEMCVKSDITVAVGGFKPGHFLNMAKDNIGSKVNCDIGIKPVEQPYRLAEPIDFAGSFARRPNFSNKGTYGYIALIGGSFCYSGAIRLAYMANAAMRSGAGVVKVAAPREICRQLMPSILESTLYPLTDIEGTAAFNQAEIDGLMRNVKTVAFGMGIGVGDGTREILAYLMQNFGGTLVIDADGLNILSAMDDESIKSAAGRLVLTPHVKEFARLIDSDVDAVLANPIGLAREYAGRCGAVVLLKGPTTVITDGDRTVLVDAGCAGMATAGSGDVLSGIMAAVCAYSDDNFDAAVLAAYINGRAGEYAERAVNPVSMIASDTVAQIPRVIGELMPR